MAASTYNPGVDQSFWGTIRWSRAVQAGLIAGVILFLLTRGIPWVGSGMINPAVMGREISTGQEATPMLFMWAVFAHFAVSILYGLIVAPIVHGFRPWMAGAVGAIVGLVLYFISYAIAGMLMNGVSSESEWPVVAIHIIFGIICAEAYKGFVRRRRPAPVL